MSGRVLHLIDTGGPGGAETVFSVLAKRLSDVGWAAVPVVPDEGWLLEHLEKSGLEPVLLPNQGAFDVGYLVRLVRLLEKTNADLLHAHLLGSGVYGSVAAAIRRIPMLCTFHGTVDLEEPRLRSRVKFRLLDRSSNRIVFVSDALRENLLERAPISRARTEVIANGIDIDRFDVTASGDFRRELGVGPDEVLVGAVGNVRPAKDYGLFLQAAARLRARDSRFRFVVVGDNDNELFEGLHRQMVRLDLDGAVTFTGLREDVPAVLSDLDIYVLTSSSEGFSLSTIEAMASRCPVVATRCGGPEEIITDGRDGRLVPTESPRALAVAVQEIADDPDSARRMAARGRRTVERKYSVGRMAARYDGLYRECLR